LGTCFAQCTAQSLNQGAQQQRKAKARRQRAHKKKSTKIKRESHRKWQMQFAYFMTRRFDGAKVLPI